MCVPIMHEIPRVIYKEFEIRQEQFHCLNVEENFQKSVLKFVRGRMDNYEIETNKTVAAMGRENMEVMLVASLH